MSCRAGPVLLATSVLAAAVCANVLYKVALTQRGYIQFLKYEVKLPPLQDFTFCLWLKTNNFSYPQPILSYSRNNRERLVRAWLEPTRLGVVARLAVMERDVLAAAVPIQQGRWSHLCMAWSGSRGSWSLHLNGRRHVAGLRPQMRGAWLAGGGDLVVGQEYTDADKGLDDGIEGEVFGFNLVRGAHHEPAKAPTTEWADQELRRRGFHECAAHRGTPVSDRRALLVSWAASPVAVFGGAVVSIASPACGHF